MGQEDNEKPPDDVDAKGIEMEGDFQGALHDLPSDNDKGASDPDSSSDDAKSLDREMGEVMLLVTNPWIAMSAAASALMQPACYQLANYLVVLLSTCCICKHEGCCQHCHNSAWQGNMLDVAALVGPGCRLVTQERW